MSKALPNWATEEFDTNVKHAYQASGGLAATVYERKNRGVKTFQFPTMSDGQAKQRVRNGIRQLMGVTGDKATATPTGYEAAETSDLFDQAEAAVEEQKELAKVIAKAVSRRKDQVIIDKLDGYTYSGDYTIAKSVGGSDTGLNLAKLKNIVDVFDYYEVDEDDRHLAAGSKGKISLLGATEVTSVDFASVKALVNGQVNEFLGLKFHWIGYRKEGGLPLSSHTRTNFAYHGGMGGSVCLGTVMEDDLKVTYENILGSWLCAQDFDSGAVVRDTQGVIEVLTHEA